MAIDAMTQPLQTENIDLRQFTLAFFTCFGAEIQLQGRKKNSPMSVKLSPELAEHFGKPDLELCFHQAEQEIGRDLVAYGSRIFDRLLTYLDRHAALTLQKLPSRFASSQELLHAIQPVNASITNLRMQEQLQLLFAFNWRITYRADDKREEIYAVLMDESGARLPTINEAVTADTIDINALLAAAEPVPMERNEEGQPLPAKLLPLTQLTRLAESARKYAIYHADVRCVAHEAEILPRLHKTLNRLTTYYQQQIEEVYDAHDPTGEKRQVLESDLQRKIAEEVENHRLRVKVDLISYAAIQVPVAVAEMTLSDGKREATLRVRRNRYNGVMRRPRCYVCDQETTAIALDRNGHLICDNCIAQCATCQDVLCERCGVAACSVCGQQNCDTCGRLCWACGERACADHINPCSVCGDDVCHACQTECACCGVRQCRSHLRVDHVLASRGQTALICATCAVRCPGCHQYSAHTDVCSASGQRFCRNCLVTCQTCGKHVGVGFYQTIADVAYCLDCLQTCPVCQAATPEITQCQTCGANSCHACGELCAFCQQPFCAQHSQHLKKCDHVVCQTDTVKCHICQGEACPLCNAACGICENFFCADHGGVCRRCGCTYCRECVRISGLCDTCATVGREGEPVALEEEPWAATPEVAALAPHYRWLRTRNARYRIYLGQNALMSSALIVVDQKAAPPQVISAHKIGMVETLRGKLWG